MIMLANSAKSLRWFAPVLALILSSAALAQQAPYKVRAVYQALSNEAGTKAFLAITEPDAYTNGVGVTLFGSKSKGNVGDYRSFVLHADEDSEGNAYAGISGNAYDDDWRLVIQQRREGRLEVTGEIRLRGDAAKKNNFKHLYQQVNPADVGNVVTVLDAQYAEYERLTKLADAPKSLAEFKRGLNLVFRRIGDGKPYSKVLKGSKDGTIPVPFFPSKVEDGQIVEGQYATKLGSGFRDRVLSAYDADKNPMGTAEIKEDMSDGISLWAKRALELDRLGVRAWSSRSQANALAKDLRENPAKYTQRRVVLAYHNEGEKAEGLTSGPLKAGAKSYVRYEIVRAHYYKTRTQNTYAYKEYTWILNDGSSYTYSPVVLVR